MFNQLSNRNSQTILNDFTDLLFVDRQLLKNQTAVHKAPKDIEDNFLHYSGADDRKFGIS
jgi:hypothetical protein